jgi:hypothetical protein
MDNLIRGWGSQGETPRPPCSPTGECLSFAEARRLAQDESADAGIGGHARQCEYCHRLILDFREAQAEVAVATASRPASGHPAWGDRAARVRRLLLRPSGLAIAAGFLIAVGVMLRLFVPAGPAPQPGPAPVLLAGARVALVSQIESGLTPKSPLSFQSGDVIAFEAQVRSAAHVLLINVDPGGAVRALPPDPRDANLQLPAGEGKLRLGPYQLDQKTGLETFFIVASAGRIDRLPSRLEAVQAAYRADGNMTELASSIRAWPADVQVVAFQHVPPSAGPK